MDSLAELDAEVVSAGAKVTAALAESEVEAITIFDLPKRALGLIKAYRGDMESLEAELELECPELELSRVELRGLVKALVIEDELNQNARNPSSTDPLIGAIDRAMHKEILRLTDRVDILSEIADEPEGLLCLIEDSGERITPEMAKVELTKLRQSLIEMKRSLVDQKKAEVASGTTSITFNMGEILASGLDNIKKMGLPVDAQVIDAE